MAEEVTAAARAPRLALVGAGWVGVVSSACFAELGARVVCIDVDAARIARLSGGELPFHEPGLAELVARGLASGRLRFTTEASAVAEADVVMLAVGTPARRGDGRADVSQVHAAARAVAPHLAAHAVVVTKSTVPVGTTREAAAILAAGAGSAVPACANPEFLREGSAVHDFMSPARIVLGVDSPREEAVLRALYAPLAAAPIVVTSVESAELAKAAANALLAMKLTFANELAALCDAVGADMREIGAVLALDPRIGPGHLDPGPGLGGSCLPKDVRALAATYAEHGIDAALPAAVLASNAAHKTRVLERITSAVGDLRGKRLVTLGLSFKAGTDDVRGSPALWLLPALAERGASIVAHDPHAGAAARPVLPAAVEIAPATLSIEELVTGADALVLITDWAGYRGLDLAALAARMRTPIAVDLRGCWPAAALAAAFPRIALVTRRIEEATPGAMLPGTQFRVREIEHG